MRKHYETQVQRGQRSIESIHAGRRYKQKKSKEKWEAWLEKGSLEETERKVHK